MFILKLYSYIILYYIIYIYLKKNSIKSRAYPTLLYFSFFSFSLLLLSLPHFSPSILISITNVSSFSKSNYTTWN